MRTTGWNFADAPAHAYGFPTWYGGSASYSPYDPVSTDEERVKPLEILLFIGKQVVWTLLTPDLPSALHCLIRPCLTLRQLDVPSRGVLYS